MDKHTATEFSNLKKAKKIFEAIADEFGCNDSKGFAEKYVTVLFAEFGPAVIEHIANGDTMLTGMAFMLTSSVDDGNVSAYCKMRFDQIFTLYEKAVEKGMAPKEALDSLRYRCKKTDIKAMFYNDEEDGWLDSKHIEHEDEWRHRWPDEED